MSREEDRYRSQRIAYLSGPSIERHQVTVRDISKSGVSVTFSGGHVRVGEMVSVDFGDGDVKRGSVRWCSDDRLGIMFE